MKMSKGRCIGVMAVIGVSCMLALLILLIVSPLLMLGVLMAGMLLTALLWRIRPKWFRAIGRVFAQEKSMPDVGRSLSREVIISDMVLWSMHDGREQIIHLNKKLIVVGLAEGCDVVLPRDCGVSRVHAKVFYSSRNKQFLVEDNNSGRMSSSCLSPVPISWRCMWVWAPAESVTCLTRPRRSLQPLSSSMRSMRWAANVAAAWAAVMTRKNRP